MKMFKTAILNDREIKADKNLEEKLHKSDSLPLKLSIRAFFRIAVPYWKSRDSFVAWGLLVLIIALTSGAVFLATAINSWYKSFWDTIQNYDIPGFKHYLWVFVALASIHVVVSVYNSYLRSCLAIRWRKWLTDSVMHDFRGFECVRYLFDFIAFGYSLRFGDARDLRRRAVGSFTLRYPDFV